MDRLMYRVSEVAELTGLGRSKAYELVASGQIGSVRIGRAVRVPAEALRRWVAEQVRVSTESLSERPTGGR